MEFLIKTSIKTSSPNYLNVMKKIISRTLFLQSMVLLLLLTTTARQAWGQCNNPAAFGTVTAPTNATPVTITTCAFAGEYSTVTGAVAGTTYAFTGTGGAGNYLTIRQGTSGGTVLAQGFSPLSATCTVSGSLFVHVNTDAACGTDFDCHTLTVACSSCAAPPPAACQNSSQFGSANIDATGALVTISTCNFAGEFSPITGAVNGQQLRFISSFAGDIITIRSGSFNGPVVASGTTPLTFTNTFTGTLFAHWNLAGCGSQSSCRVTTVQCLSCAAPPFNPCASTPTILCGGSTTATISGSGVWSPGSCGFTTPGQERVYVFTPTTTGVHNLQVTSTSSTAFVDYFVKPVSSGCNGTGWTCIDDIISPFTASMGSLTAGVPYYILLDPESTVAVTQTFQINCPSAIPPPCLAAPTSPTNGQNNICPSSTQTLSWPASTGATSYDVYFGTTAVPAFVGTTASTSFVATTPTNGTYFWQVRPVNANGTASGCTIWSFNKSDVQAPSITCPASVTINNTTNLCSGVVTYGSITATDNCTAPSIILLSGPASASVQPVGVYTIVYRATDAAGNSSTCSFSATVRDVQVPTITCPANIVKNTDPNLCGSITTYSNPTFADNCSATLSQQSGLGSGALFPVGTTPNVFRAIDAAGNFVFCTFTVRVNDAQAPAITCPPTLTLGNDVGECGRAISWVGQAAASDNCGIAANSSNNPGYLPVGTHTVIHTVTDNSGNTRTCAQTVNVNDIEFPFIVCPANIAVTTDDFDCIATVNFSASAGDNCPGFTVGYSTPTFTAFEPGSNTVFATVTDASGNESNCSFRVIVNTRTEICNDFDDDCDGLVDETDDWENVAKVFAPNGATNQAYGGAVDIDGDYAIASSTNAVHILKRGSAGWASSAQLVAPGVVTGDQYGSSVALDSNFAVVGAPGTNGASSDEGAVYVFAKDINDGWSFVKKIKASDAGDGDRFGGSVALDSLTLVVGSSSNDETGQNSGAAYVFSKDLVAVDSFGQAAKLLAITGNTDDNMGLSVAIHGNHIVVGATGVDGFYQNSGAAYVFGRNQNGPDAWGQVARMRSQQSRENDNFGSSVGISGNYAIVGASQNDQRGNNAGAAFVFFRNLNGINDSWGQRNILYDFDGSAGENYGSSVAIQGKYAVVGARNDNPYGSGSGRLYVYERQPDDNWLVVDKPADVGGQINDNLGTSVAISGRTIVAGMPSDDNGSSANQGSVLFFEGICANQRPQATYRQESAGKETLRAYPVPFSDVLNIDVEGFVSDDLQITVINALGQTVADIHRGAVASDMTLQWRPEGNISEGIYFLRLRNEEKTMTQTIVLSRQR